MNKLRVLMVEDEVAFSACYADWFREEPENIVFDIVTTVEEAIQRLTNYDYDVAVIDYHIGDGVGTDLMSQLTALPRARTLRCYAMTGDARPETLETISRYGFVRTLVKPIRHSEFMDILTDEAQKLETDSLRKAVFG